MIKLRQYQKDAVLQTRDAISSGYKRPLIVAATGAGKTIIYGDIIRRAVEKGNKCLFLVHRRNLAHQFRETIENEFYIGCGIIMAGEEFESGLSVYCSTIQTYSKRMDLYELEFNQFWIDADIILTDESHASVSATYRKVLDAYRDKIIIGCTATPVRADGRGLGAVYDKLLDVAGTKRLTDEGFLSPVRYFAPREIDLSKVKEQMGDYQKKSLARVVDRPKIIGDIVDSWLKLAEGRKTIVFAVNVAHSRHLAEAFNHVGVGAIHLDAKSADDERASAFAKMENGVIKIICNNLLYVEGMDVPDVSCIVMARPTKSIGLYRQAVGRGMRLSKDKEDLIVIDHGNVVREHGFVTDEIEWILDDKEKAWTKKQKPKEKRPVKCRSCHEIFESASKCPVCGTEVRSFGKPVEAADGELEELTDKKKPATLHEKRIFLGMLKYYVKENGKNHKMVYGAYRGRFGVWPSPKVNNVSPIKPDQLFKSYMLHQRIKYARSMEKRGDSLTA
ncbi:MAG TPA: DEAD/DEAH box helicase [Desulfocapsa sulfexigens]|nr:DEAD/DEAH box helicase [Desulfocapsa sulfexigens]